MVAAGTQGVIPRPEPPEQGGGCCNPQGIEGGWVRCERRRDDLDRNCRGQRSEICDRRAAGLMGTMLPVQPEGASPVDERHESQRDGVERQPASLRMKSAQGKGRRDLVANQDKTGDATGVRGPDCHHANRQQDECVRHPEFATEEPEIAREISRNQADPFIARTCRRHLHAELRGPEHVFLRVAHHVGGDRTEELMRRPRESVGQTIATHVAGLASPGRWPHPRAEP